MGYLTGFFEDGHERLMILAVHEDGRSALLAPALSATHAQRCGIDDVRAWRDGEDPTALVRALAEEWGLAEAGVAVDDEMRASVLLSVQGVLPSARFQPGLEVLTGLTAVKEPGELEAMRAAGRVADEALAPALAQLRPGMTELDVARVIEDEMLRGGGEPVFCIVASGPHSAEPHHETGDRCLEAGDVVVIDFGCVVDRYLSDITRTVALGEPPEGAREVYAVVHRAFMAGRGAVRPGVAGQEVDRAARAEIVAAGYGEAFVHRTGHGIGMRGHEPPYMTEGNAVPLAVGNCFSVEPGVYLPGRFGVRIENIVTVTADGHESLNAEPSPTLVSVPV